MADEEKQEKKIIVDEDWKKQAQQEKEILAAQEAEEKKKTKADDEAGLRRGPLPKGDIAGLISMLTTQALFALGVLGVKGQEQREPDLELARYNIDMLEALEAKTKGNLTAEEQQALTNTLSELRMGYVQIADQGSKPSE